MRPIIATFVITLAVGGLQSFAFAQDGPEPGAGRERPRPAADGKADSAAVDAIVARLMAFDKNKDGKLTRDEITDERLLRMFDRADANKDGVVTKDELVALAKQLVADDAANGFGRSGFGFPGGPGGPGGFGGPPRPGQILPPFLQEELGLSADQKKQIAELQKEVDAKLDKILTDAQKQQLKEMRPRFGPPPRRGRRGPGGPNGPTPDDRRNDDRRGDRGPGGPPPEGP
jgi:EF hand